MVDQPKENELDEEKEATASSKEAKKDTAKKSSVPKEREKRRKGSREGSPEEEFPASEGAQQAYGWQQEPP